MQVRAGGQSFAVQITASHAAEVTRNGSKSGRLRTYYDCLLSKVSPSEGMTSHLPVKKKNSFLEVLHLVKKTEPALTKTIQNHGLAKYTNYST
jgi:hypothetical protein